ncbi:YTH domain-containing protein ECT1-like isoform X2 [Oryza brachyantha]|nr:YTH domain-containing protein ECT1-like isoform X2 [Oryza brachyantha]
MGPTESHLVVEKNSSTSVIVKEQILSTEDHSLSTTHLRGASSLKSTKSGQEKGSFLGKGGEQHFVYQSNVYAPQPHTVFSGGYFNHLGQWEEYPHVASADGTDTASPVMYSSYSPVPTMGDSQPYFPLHYPLSSPYYQPPASPSMGYSNSASGMSHFDPMHEYCLPDGLLYSPTPGLHRSFSSFDGTQMQQSVPGFYGQGNIPSGMHQGSMYGSGSYKARQQIGNFGGSTPSWGAGSRRFSPLDRGFKHDKGSLEFMNEQNRGPRATKPKKEVNNSSTEEKNRKTQLTIDSSLYNQPDFTIEYEHANFFVIKSYTEDNVHKSIKYGVWASTASGNRKLNAAYHEAKEKEANCPIFLFFSVNGSGQFCGVAEMIGPVDFDKSVDYWQQDKWSGQFPVKWHIVKDVPNNLLRHIILENNDNKPVTNSRDTQEVRLDQGLQMLKIFKNHVAETTILEDFDFYEEWEKAMLDIRQRQKQQYGDSELQKPTEAKEPVDLVTQISATFARAVQLGETKGSREDRPKVDDASSAAVAEDKPVALVKTEESLADSEPSPLKEGG